MEMPNNASPVRYAVIQLRESDGSVERFVIGYHDEGTLRGFLARPSIVATGFLSRDEATKKSSATEIENSLPVRIWQRFGLLNMRALFRLQGRMRATRVMNSAVQAAETVLQEIRSRLIHARRRLAPAVQ